MIQILAINATARNACITGDLPTADRLFTQEINADNNNYNSYANRSFVMARKADWDHALDDALKVRYSSCRDLLICAVLHINIEHQYPTILDGLYLQGHRTLWKTTVPRRNESI
jgi:hypothetical protein